jgi:hypothetical protein
MGLYRYSHLCTYLTFCACTNNRWPYVYLHNMIFSVSTPACISKKLSTCVNLHMISIHRFYKNVFLFANVYRWRTVRFGVHPCDHYLHTTWPVGTRRDPSGRGVVVIHRFCPAQAPGQGVTLWYNIDPENSHCLVETNLPIPICQGLCQFTGG